MGLQVLLAAGHLDGGYSCEDHDETQREQDAADGGKQVLDL